MMQSKNSRSPRNSTLKANDLMRRRALPHIPFKIIYLFIISFLFIHRIFVALQSLIYT